MKIEKHAANGLRYTLSNEGLKINDEVFPIARGRCLDDGSWILHDFDYDYDFPNDPHKILDMHHANYKAYQIRTDKGYGPIESYYKIIKVEEQIVDPETANTLFKHYIWTEIMPTQLNLHKQ